MRRETKSTYSPHSPLLTPHSSLLTSMSTSPPLLDVRGLTKSFPGVRALDDVNLHAGAGEVLAVVGENGAGKSTLMKILAGVYLPDGGDVLLDGQPVRLCRRRDALATGISLIHQELNLAENLSVAANLFLGRGARSRRPARLARPPQP